MPHLATFAQRFRNPNGTTSATFVVPMRLFDMRRFAARICNDEWPEWRGCLKADGRVDVAKMEAKKAADDFTSGSARLSCAHDGRFWNTVRIWNRHVCEWPTQIGNAVVGEGFPVAGDADDRRLFAYELAILFASDDQAGFPCSGCPRNPRPRQGVCADRSRMGRADRRVDLNLCGGEHHGHRRQSRETEYEHNSTSH